MIIKISGKDAQQALSELTSNIQYDNLECEVTQLNAEGVHLMTVREALDFIDGFDGYGMTATDESEQVERLRQFDLEDDYDD